MSEDSTRHKAPFPFYTVVVTVIVTLILTGSIAYLLGYLSPEGIKLSGIESASDVSGNKKGAPLFSCGMHPWIITKEAGDCPICGMKLTPKREDADASEEKKEKKIAYWRAPMNPTEIYDKPGKSAMGMDLVPVYEDELVGGVAVKIDPVTEQNMGIRTAIVEKGPLVYTIRTYGHITYDETRTAQINLKFNGWLEKLYVDFTGKRIKKGDPLFEIYSPELITAQEEYLEAYRNLKLRPGKGENNMLSSIRRRLSYFDVAKKEIKAIESSGIVSRTMTIRSPYKGIVTQKNTVEGGFIKAGTMIYNIADISSVWVEAHIYEYELSGISQGQKAEMSLPYLPGKVYSGKVTYVYPYLQKKTRDVVVRLEFRNPGLALKPDMYADVRIMTTPKKEGIIIPSEAIIRSGERNVVFVRRGESKFTLREVTLGIALDNGKVQVLTGLAPGESIVTSGQFLLDSESKLKEAVQKMLEVKKKTDDSEDDFFDDME